MTKCKSCGEEIEDDAKVCPHCDAEVKKGFFATPWIMLAIVIYIVAEIFAGRTVGVAPKSDTATEVIK